MKQVKASILLVHILLVSHFCNGLMTALSEAELSINQNLTQGATLRTESTLSSPAIVKTYTHEDLKAFHSLIDFLQYVPGFAVDNARRNYQYIQVRGNNHQLYNNKILVLINGHKIADEVGPETNLDIVPIEAIRRLEIVRGPGSVLYGANAFAASIHIHTFDALSYQKNKITMTLGNDSQKASFIELKENPGRGLKSYFAYKFNDEKGANHPVADQLSMNGQGITAPWALDAFEPVDTHRFTFSDLDNYILKDQHNSFLSVLNAGELRLTLGKTNISRNMSYLFRGDINGVGLNYSYEYIGGDFEKQITDKLWWKFRSKYSQARVLTSESGFDPLQPAEPGFHATSNSYAHDIEMQWTYFPNSKTDWIFGGVTERFSYNRDIQLDFINGFRFDFPLTPSTFSSINGLYLQGTYRLTDRLELLGALRRNSNSHYGSNYVPKLALSYALKENEFFKIIWGRSFRYPSGHEAFTQLPGIYNPNPDLMEEKVESFEIDYVRSMDGGRKSLELTYFRLKLEDFIFYNTRPNANRMHQNAGDLLESEGLEMDFSLTVTDGLKAWLNATVMDLKGPVFSFDNGLTDTLGRERFGDFTQSTLKRFGAVGANWKASDQWQLSYAARYRGYQRHRFEDRYLYMPQGSYFVHDLSLTYSHSEDREVTLDIDNLTEKYYQPIDYDIQTNKAQSYPTGRSVRLSYTIRF